MYYKITLLALLLVGWLFWNGLQSPVSNSGGALIGKDLPPFALNALHGEQILSHEHLPHKRFLLNVWASWCVACRQEHSYLESLSRAGIALVGVNYKDAREDALAWLEQFGDPYLFHISDERGQLALDLGVSGAPESFVVDVDGVIRHHHVGVLNERVFGYWREWLKH